VKTGHRMGTQLLPRPTWRCRQCRPGSRRIQLPPPDRMAHGLVVSAADRQHQRCRAR
jgi:hypothetical protein